jgi:hypothetical protein
MKNDVLIRKGVVVGNNAGDVFLLESIIHLLSSRFRLASFLLVFLVAFLGRPAGSQSLFP